MISTYLPEDQDTASREWSSWGRGNNFNFGPHFNGDAVIIFIPMSWEYMSILFGIVSNSNIFIKKHLEEPAPVSEWLISNSKTQAQFQATSRFLELSLYILLLFKTVSKLLFQIIPGTDFKQTFLKNSCLMPKLYKIVNRWLELTSLTCLPFPTQGTRWLPFKLLQICILEEIKSLYTVLSF